MYKHIKSLVPNNWKYPFWYIFKSPQRQINPYSLLHDISGIAIYLWYNLIPLKEEKLKPITICTGIFNRSEHYINRLLKSLNDAKFNHLIELSVYDCGSNDIENLEQTIRQYWKGNLQFQSECIPFNRAYSFNQAAKKSTNDILFICDADMTLPDTIVELCNSYTAKHRVWYPIYFFLYRNKSVVTNTENGEWEQYGSKGMFACIKKDFLEIGGLNENYKTWGEEDTELWSRFHKAGFTIIRNRQKDFYHHWHETHNPKYSYMNEQS